MEIINFAIEANLQSLYAILVFGLSRSVMILALKIAVAVGFGLIIVALL
ncbi:MAG TPA: hypothetical protein VKY92_16745 [Verrucomicrobiae bacterium]|nr:hypothetical protein [Verrucomicrobiae bacterium]